MKTIQVNAPKLGLITLLAAPGLRLASVTMGVVARDGRQAHTGAGRPQWMPACGVISIDRDGNPRGLTAFSLS